MVPVEEAGVADEEVGFLGEQLDDLWVCHDDQVHKHLAGICSTLATLNLRTGDSLWLLRMPRTSSIILTMNSGSSWCRSENTSFESIFRSPFGLLSPAACRKS